MEEDDDNENLRGRPAMNVATAVSAVDRETASTTQRRSRRWRRRKALQGRRVGDLHAELASLLVARAPSIHLLHQVPVEATHLHTIDIPFFQEANLDHEESGAH